MKFSFEDSRPVYPQATIYYWQDFTLLYDVFDVRRQGYLSMECRDLRYAIVDPYSNKFRRVRIECKTRKKGARPKYLHMGGHRLLVIVEGWGHPTLECWNDSGRGTKVIEVFASHWPKAISDFVESLSSGGAIILDDFRRKHLSNYERPQAYETINVYEDSTTDPAEVTSPDEVLERIPELLEEGAVAQITVNKFERNREARQRCLEFHGTRCWVCKFDFGKEYPGIGKGYIHVHHLVPLSQIRKNYTVDPVTDLLPVCANCHAMLHSRTGDPYTPEDLIAIREKAPEEPEEPEEDKCPF